MKTTPDNFKQQLSQILEKEERTIAALIIKLALKRPDPIDFIRYLCIRGYGVEVFNEFAPYSTPKDFYEQCAEDIEQVRMFWKKPTLVDTDDRAHQIVEAIRFVAFQLFWVYLGGDYTPLHRQENGV